MISGMLAKKLGTTVLQETFVILPCEPVCWKYLGSEQVVTINSSPDVYGEPELVM
jgi:hypothetical protein